MFNTLRSRLLLSYIGVIAIALLVITLALLFFASRPGVRYLSTMQHLAAVGASNRQQLFRLVETGADTAAYERLLEQTAVDNNVRVIIADITTKQILYDSQRINSWLGDTIEGVQNLRRLLPNVDTNAITGVFEHSDGSRWLVYSQPVSSLGFGRLQIFYAAPEPTTLAFFRQAFFRPIVVGAGVALLLSILLAAGLANWVVRPLRQMDSAAEGVARGDYDQQLSLDGPAEVQRLAASFNSMSSQVKKTQQAQRDFVSNVSHDLKTPLTSILGWSQSLLDGTADTDAARQQAATIIHNETERMQRMVNQLLDLARIESGQLRLTYAQVDLQQVLTEVHDNLARRAQEQSTFLTCDLQPVPPIWGDYDRLMQVFTNLVDNAMTHTPAGGRVHLSLKPQEEEIIEVKVQDTGTGIAPEDLPRIFERFYQADKSRVRDNGRRGSGLGLAIVRELVEAHQGTIRAYSQPGQGSAFVVRLPAQRRQERPNGSRAA
ncbi:MAG: HAMP domain-containing protein [Anaerolineales bacterium]|nr:HAMP domain-containing protein [Anaerolineales bacterium]